ncbi:MAG: hypothetical protein K9J72_00780 [Synechococcus sp. Tobar2m-G35]|jgi:hypothetical protein|nr:hypothetical protein [Synechococcus sp. Tobar2m-G35]
MVFQKLFGGERKPFLELSEVDGDQPTTTVAPAAPASKPVATAPAPAGPQAVTLQVPVAEGAATANATTAATATISEPTTAPVATSTGAPSLTTAEALAAERAAAQKAEAPRELTTFAAELLNPAQALPRGRRRPGANLAAFKDLAVSLRGGR